jgi:hypothetical protein
MGDTTLQPAANSLNGLPTEILLLIAESLSEISKASFSLCSRSVYQKLRCQYVRANSHRLLDKLIFAQVLEVQSSVSSSTEKISGTVVERSR